MYSGFGNSFGTKGIFKLISLHHLGAVALEWCVLSITSDIEHAVLACEMMLALVGTTGCMHFVCICAYPTPIRENALCSFLLHAVTLCLMLWYRFVKWVYLLYACILWAFSAGWVAGLTSVLAFALFTAFNVDFLRHYIKITKKTWVTLTHPHQN